MDLDTLNTRIAARAKASPDESYTAKLIAEGTGRCAKKFGEESVELTIAAISGKKKDIAAESADVLYHFLVLLRSAGVTLDDVMAELDKRTTQSGLAEKASRGRTS